MYIINKTITGNYIMRMVNGKYLNITGITK